MWSKWIADCNHINRQLLYRKSLLGQTDADTKTNKTLGRLESGQRELAFFVLSAMNFDS